METAKENSITDSFKFLSGGGEMGELIRSFDWSKTPVGNPATWPQSLCIAVRIMLDSPFGMYIAWGKEYIQLYNDGYLPILGSTKHPQALGISTRKTFAEIWPTIGPMFDAVMQGTPVGFPDFTLQLDRNGYLEECVFDFSYSPIRLVDGEVGGVLVTVIETTEKVNSFKKLAESNDQLNFAIEATELGTWDYNPLTNKFTCNNRLKEWFGLPHEADVDLSLAIEVMVEKDRNRVADAIQKALQYESGGLYDIEYGIINSVTKQERIVRAKGRAWFGNDKKAYRVNGTLQDITEVKKAQVQLEQSVRHLQIATDSANVGTWSLDIKSEKLTWSSLHKKMWGYDENNNDLNYEDWHKIILPEDKEYAFEKVEEARVNHTEYEVAYYINRANDGALRYMRSFGKYYYNDKGEAQTLTGITIDITEQKEVEEKIKASETKFRTLSETIPIMIWTATPDGKKNFFNKFYLEYTGLSLEELKDDGMLKIIFPDDLKKDLELWHHSLKNGEDFNMEKRLRRHDGTYRWHISHGIAQKDIQGNITGWIGSSTDIHEQKTNAEEKFLLEFAEEFSQYETGTEFFSSLVTFIANKTNIDYVFVGELTENEKNIFTIKTIALANRGKLVPNIEYPLPDGPCEQVIQGTLYNYPNQCKITFPKNQTLVQFNVEGYVGYPLFDIDGKAIGLVAVMHEKEISNPDYVAALLKIVAKRTEYEMERNKITHQLHIQNETFKQAEESSMQGSYSFNLTTGKLAYSDNLYQLIGYVPNEFEPSLEEFNKHVHPEDKDYVQQAAQKVLQNKTADEWHYRMNTKTGTVINIKATGRVIESGDEKLLVGTLQDITKEFELNKELQEKEEYRRQIINNAPDAVIVINEQSVITLWNPKTEEIFGWKAEEVLGLQLTDIIVPIQYRQAHREGMNRFLKTGEARILNKSLELTALNKDGKEFPISLTISQATQQGNKLFIAFLRDITLEKRTKELAISNQSLLKANIELEASQKFSEKLLNQKDEFISIASHEMKTPLTTAKGYLELLLSSLSQDDPSAYLFANRANNSLEKLHDLVSELLDASKIQNGKLNYNIATFDFDEMLNETIEDIQHSSKNHTIQKTGKVLKAVIGDKGRLQQVVINLLTNAIKYSPNADKILVNVEEKENVLQLSIHDFGIGMASQHLNKVFDRYYRIEEHSKHFQGLGIGLYISYDIITRHHGTMWAESEPGKGTTFYFELPV